MENEAEIVTNPAAHFDGPIDLAKSKTVDDEIKQAALSTWQQHAEALDVAADEGMAPGPHEVPLRPELETAFDIIAEKDNSEVSTRSQPQKEAPDMNRPDKNDTSKLAADTSQVGDDIAHLARAAIEAIRAATDEFASKAGVSKSEAVDAVRNAGQAAVAGLGNVAGEARAMTETGLDTLGKSVIRNPLAALAIAAGTGLLLGLLSRQDTRR